MDAMIAGRSSVWDGMNIKKNNNKYKIRSSVVVEKRKNKSKNRLGARLKLLRRTIYV